MSMKHLIEGLEEASADKPIVFKADRERDLGSRLNTIGRVLRELGDYGKAIQDIEDRIGDSKKGGAITKDDLTKADREALLEVVSMIYKSQSSFLTKDALEKLRDLIGRN